MSTTTIIVVIVCILGVLVSYAFVQQTMKNKREQRSRMVNALKSRSRNFKFMLSGFPQGFLTKELTQLVQRSLVDVCEQLSKLEPSEVQHMQDLQVVSAQMTENQRQAKPTQPAPLENHQQIKDVKACLEELNKFVVRLEEKSTISRNQAQVYKNQIRQMVLQVTVDSYCLNGNQARQNNKTKLAIHYFDLALKLIVRESKTEFFRKKVVELKTALEQLNEKLLAEEDSVKLSSQEQAEKEEVEEEWGKFSDKSDDWKKKNIYD